jgi:hypothetical protein
VLTLRELAERAAAAAGTLLLYTTECLLSGAKRKWSEPTVT